MEKETLLLTHNLGVKFDGQVVLQDINFFVKKGDVMAIVGPNGSGKSVLFRALLNLIPYSGSIEWQKGLKINYIPQKFYIDRDLPLSVEEFFKFKNKNRNEIVQCLLSVGAAGDEHQTHPEHHIRSHILPQRLGWLSGGQLQRIFIGWSIIDNPDVLLFDEPTAGIDVGGEETIYNLLKRMRDERDITIILISHDLNIIYKYANNVICLNRKMICFGAPNIVLDPTALAQLYGGEAGFYKHEHKHEHGH